MKLQKTLSSKEIFDNDMLRAKLASLDRELVDVEGDGNCLFNSVSDQMTSHPTKVRPCSAKLLHFMVVQYMRDHKTELEVNIIYEIISKVMQS